MTKIYWSQIDGGVELPAYNLPPLNRVKIAKFAGITQDYSPLHLDDQLAKAEGFGGAFAHSLFSLGFAEQMVTHFADNIRILDLTGTFHKLVWPGDSLTARGTVIKAYKKHGEHRMDIDLLVENQNRDVIMKGSVTCLLFVDEADEKKHKIKIPATQPATKEELQKACHHLIKH